MKKFILAFTLVLTLFLISNISVFAVNNDVENSAMKATDGVRNVVGGAENAVENVVDSSNGINTMENGNTNNGGTTDIENTSDFTATRTATDGGTTDAFGTAWTWIIVAIIAIVIIAVIWYYSTRTNDD